MKRLLFCLPLLVLLSSACSKGSSEIRTAVAIGEAQLEAMLVSISNASFGEEYLDMELSEDNSGPEDAAGMIEDADDPEDERADLENFGFVSGYGRYYFRPDAIFERRGPFVVGASVLLFETADGASGYLEDDLSDGQRDLSGTTEVGSLQGFEVFDVDIGEEAWGAFVTVLGDADFYGTAADFDTSITLVLFRRDRILGGAFVFRADGTSASSEALNVARELDSRIERVLNGEEVSVPEVATKIDAEAGELLRQSRQRLADAESFRMVQSLNTTRDGSTYLVDSDFHFLRPNLIYGTSSGVDLALVGLNAYVQAAPGTWECLEDVTGFSLQELGMNPSDLTAQLDIDGIATEIAFLSNKNVDGYQVKHIRAVLDPDDYLDRTRELLGARGALGATLDTIDFSSVTFEAYIDLDLMMRRINIDIRMRVDGVPTNTRTEAVFSEYGRDFDFPLAEPYPVCGAQKS